MDMVYGQAKLGCTEVEECKEGYRDGCTRVERNSSGMRISSGGVLVDQDTELQRVLSGL